MMKHLGTLFYSTGSPQSWKCLIAAKLSRLDNSFTKQTVSSTAEFTFESGSTILKDPSAIAYLLSSEDLSFKNDISKISKVIQWISFSKDEIVPFLQGIIQQPGLTRDGRYQNKLRVVRLTQALDHLNHTLKNNEFLVGNRLSLADIELVVDLIPAFCSDQILVSNDQISLRQWFEKISSIVDFREICDVTKIKFGGNGNTTKRISNKNAPSPVEINPLKILCLHGYRQNEVMFRDKLGAFRKMVGKAADFKFITAPHQVLPLEDVDAENQNQDQRGWWFSREDNFFRASFASDCDKGFNESLNLILDACKMYGPFDGVLGFSQGAAMAGLLCSMQANDPTFPTNFKFSILFAGFKSQSSKHSKWYNQNSRVNIASLHVYGLEDKVIGDMSQELVPFFEAPTIVEHPGGHFIPATSRNDSTLRNKAFVPC